MPNRNAIHFGAGNIGRGFIGPLLVKSGYHVTFADVDRSVIDAINEHGEYSVHILEPKKPRPMTISDISGVMSSGDSIANDIADPEVDIITTSVGVGVLPKIAGTLAKGLKERRKTGRGPVNVIACENTVGATEKLAEAVNEHLSNEDKEYVKQNVGFANCSVDRIAPPFEHESPLDVGVEGFYEWIVEKGALKNLCKDGSLNIEGMLLTDDLAGYVERKLFTLNTGHAITSYLGFLHGYATIDESIQHDDVLRVVRGAMRESGAALLKKHPSFSEEEHQKYTEKIEARFRNPNIRDEVKRVGREPLRKLGRNDRLLGPAYMAREYGLPVDNLSRGIAAAFLYENEEDEQAVELQEKIGRMGIEKVVAEVTEFKEGSEEFGKIVTAYRELHKLKSKQ